MKLIAVLLFARARTGAGASSSSSSSSSSEPSAASAASAATPPVLLTCATDLSAFSYFTRGTIAEHIRFACRTVAQRTPANMRQTVTLQEVPFVVHVHARSDGLIACAVADQEYPPRVAFAFLLRIADVFEEQTSEQQWRNATQDNDQEIESIRAELIRFQNPSQADTLTKVSQDLDAIKDILSTNIEQLLQRGEKLDTLMERSEDLSRSSLAFYQTAKSQNQCCSMY